MFLDTNAHKKLPRGSLLRKIAKILRQSNDAASEKEKIQIFTAKVCCCRWRKFRRTQMPKIFGPRFSLISTARFGCYLTKKTALSHADSTFNLIFILKENWHVMMVMRVVQENGSGQNVGYCMHNKYR